MSLEAAMIECTSALRALANLLSGAHSGLPAQAKTVDVVIPPPAAPAPPPDTDTTPTVTEPADPYAQAAEAITKLSRAKGREAALAVLNAFGANRLPDVPKDRLADVVARATAALEG